MVSKMILMLTIMLSSFCVFSQNYTPKSYYTFEGSNPMKDSLGFINLDPAYYASGYSINSNPANVGVTNYMALDSTATIIRGGTLAIDSAVTFEFLFKPGFYFGTSVFLRRMDGAVELRMSYPLISFSTTVTSTSGSSIFDDFQITLDGTGRKNYGYFIDGNWHHIVFKYNAKTGIKEVWIDGQLPDGFSKTVTGGSFASSGNREYVLNSQSAYYKYQGAIDELAVYYNSLGGNSIYQHYLNFTNKQHYSFANPTVTAPAASPVTAGMDINEYAPGHPSPTLTPIEQVKNFPTPRYKPGHTLYPNNPFIGYYYLSGYNTYESSYANAVANSKVLQKDFVNNFNYLFVATESTGEFAEFGDTNRFSGAWIKMANQNPQWKTTALTYWPQLHPSDVGKSSGNPYVTCQCLPNNSYLRNSAGAFLNPQGGTGTYKWISPAGPKDSLVFDGLTQKYYLQQLLGKMTRSLDYIFENGEVVPFLYYSNVMASDPAVVADKNATGLDWFTYEGKRAAEKINAYKSQFMGSLAGLANTKFAYYQLDGQNQWNFKWSEVRSINTPMNNNSYATGDIYVRWPSNWRYWTSAWRGWQWVAESRHEQLASGDKYFSPAVSPGWDNNEEINVRPAQWLGFLKAVSMAGAEFYTIGYFVTSQPYQNPKGYVWQMVMPSYAQAITSRYEDLFRNGYLMGGDVPNSTSNPLYMAYSFYAGDPRKLVVIRKHNTLNKYAITGTIQPSSNMLGATETEGIAQIKLDGQTLKFQVRRQGSTYIYDNTTPASPIFYQLDGWHEKTYPYYWTKDFNLEAELFDNTNTDVYLKTTRPAGAVAGDFTTYTTSIGFNAVSSVTYNFQPRASVNNNYYVWVLARSKNGQSTGMSILLDGANSKQIGCVTDTNWVWYKYNLSTSAAISFSSVTSGVDHVLTLTPTNTNLEIDKVLLTTNSGAVYTSPSPCAAAATPTITASGPLAFCTGSSVTLTASTGTSYSWSNGATTQSITVSSAGNYSVTVTSAAGTGTSSPVTVTVNALPTATLTAGGATTFCQGGSVTLSAGTATTYLWSPGNQTTQSISATTSGNYSVKVTNASGCSATSGAKTVTVNALPAATISASGSTTFAPGGSVTLTASSAGTGGNYIWSPGNQTTQSITVSAAGSYTVRVTNSSGCSATSAATVVTVTGTIVPKITGSGPTSFCQGGSVVLTCSAANTYLWSTGATTQSITVTTSGTYSCTATTASGTGTAAAVTVYVATPTASTITASGATAICQGSNVTLTANSGASYLWSPGGQTTQAISATAAGSYTVRVTDVYGCSSVSPAKTVTVNAVPTATITASGSTTFNVGGSVTLTASSAGTGGSYLWSPGNQTTQAITVSTGGSYSVRVTNAAGCSATSSATTVTVNSTTQATITVSGTTTFCQGKSAKLTSSKGASYLWSTGQTSRSITVTQPGSYVVTVVAFNTGVIMTSIPVVITVNSLPTASVTASGATTFCSGSSVNLTSTTATSYLWSPNGETTKTITATTSGSYTVKVTNINGCTATSAATTVTANNCSGTCLSPGNKTTTNITGSSATLNWSYVSADNFYVQLVNMSTGSVYNSAALGNGVTSITIGVAPSTTYRWYVRSRCGTTYTAWGSYATFTTPSLRVDGSGSGASSLPGLTPMTPVLPSDELASDNLNSARSAFVENSLSVFPNPASNYVDLLVNSADNAISKVIIRDLTNRVIKTMPFTITSGSNQMRIDLSGIAKGTYLITVDSPEFKSLKKLVIE